MKSGRFIGLLLLGLTLAVLVSPAAQAQPFGGWLILTGEPSDGWIEVPANATLNPTGAFTFEAWVSVSNNTTGEDCRSIAGKSFVAAWWIGVCNVSGSPQLRSYLRGGGSSKTGGVIPRGIWTHIAVTSDGVTRRHYINGVEAPLANPVEGGPLTTSTAAVRIGSDVSWLLTPAGAIDEVNLWNVVRTQAQIQADLAGPITGPVQGLLAVWSFNGSGRDSVAVYNGSASGAASFGAPAPPPGAWLTTGQLPGFRFKVRINGTTTGIQEPDCVSETLCVSGAVPGRSEVFVRVVGPRPNGYLWPHVAKFTTSPVEVWIEQLSTGSVKYYVSAGPWPGLDDLPGLYDRTGFLP
ncbi:MAG TPA: LamG domain-containing protein [Thermoanaerobaculia bacterium]|nr:LamG domain-containing protein [Thermoanaerobaculia bacterium]